MQEYAVYVIYTAADVGLQARVFTYTTTYSICRVYINEGSEEYFILQQEQREDIIFVYYSRVISYSIGIWKR